MKCPGQDSRNWKPGDIFEINCPRCGHALEFFKDEPVRRCKKCGHRFVNPKMDFGCASYCKFADQCLGDMPPELLAKRKDLLKDRVAIEMKRYFQRDFKRIGHATKVARYAQRLLEKEGGDPAVILCAAYLHDIGIKKAEEKYQSTAAGYQQQEGPPIAREILTRLGAEEDLIEEVCDIVGHHHQPRAEETTNFMVLYDADLIVNKEEQQKESPQETNGLAAWIENAFLTPSGQNLAKKLFLKEETASEAGT